MSAKQELEFEIGFFESLGKRMPKDFNTLEILAELYTRCGKITEGLRLDRRLVRLRPESASAHYNLACSLALKERKKEATEVLKTAIQLGYEDFEWMRKDDDFEALRGYAPFETLLNRHCRDR